MSRRPSPLLALPLLFLLPACSAEEPETQEPVNICENFDTPYDDIKVGLTKPGDGATVQIELVTLSPAEPAEDVENVWTVKLMDMSDAPMPGATITGVLPYMPDHGHGAQEPPTAGATSAAGEVEIQNLRFHMPGVWTVTFDVEESQTVTDAVTFGVCIGS
ncbi:MAG: FixH family protein [Myxococcales bacterium]|nr:FixH family protein [Myxococcales bacterium]